MRPEAGEDAGRPLLTQRGLLQPHQARRSISFPFALPPEWGGDGALRLRLAFSPAVVNDVRNLLTLSLFDPHGFRGAGHRHAPRQEVLVAPDEATPGFLPGPLPPGTWTVEVDCHCVLPSDAGGVEYDLEVSFLPRSTRRSAPRPAPPEPPSGDLQPRWLRGDLHLHSDHSDGRWKVAEIVRYARGRRLDFLAVTDHNTSSANAEVAAAVREAGPGSPGGAGGAGGAGGLVVVPGMEMTTYYGHCNALGLTDWIDWRVAPPGARDGPGVVTRTMEGVAAEVHQRGGTFVVNHPRAIGYPQCTGCRWEFGEESAVYADAVEVWNGPWHGPWRRQNTDGLALWDTWLNAGYHLPAVAGSDGHLLPRRPETVGLTCVYAAPDPQAILAAVRAGRSYLTSGPTLLLRDPPLGQPLPRDADCLAVTLDDLDGPVDLCLVAGGERVAQRAAVGDGEVVLPLPAGGAWFRVEVYRAESDLLLAMTNPIYRS
jgi:hypothetical protein